MEPKGYILIKREFTATTMWPSPQHTLSGIIDLEKEYKEALAGRPCAVMDIAVDKSGYLVLGHSKNVGDFIWMIEKEDTIGEILPVIWRNGELIPAGMSFAEEIAYMAQALLKKDNK